MIRSTVFVVCLVCALLVTVIAWQGCSKESPITSDGDLPLDFLVPPANRLFIGPIEGLTTVYHYAPTEIAVPLGTTVKLLCPAPPGATVECHSLVGVMRYL